jgi:hypothetical protein
MKEKDGIVNYPEQQVILYVEKEDGQYGPMQTGSYLSGNYMDDYEVKRQHLEENLRTGVLKGEISIIRYYMVLEDLSLAELAARVGLRKSQVSRHLDPVNFGKVKILTLKKYADVFNVPISNMLQVIMMKKGDKIESYTVLEEKKQTEGISYADTKNPFVVLTNIGEIK